MNNPIWRGAPWTLLGGATYTPASSHGDSSEFRKRMRQRQEQAERERRDRERREADER